MNKAEVAVLFDLDGVLIDSESTYSEFWTEIDRIYPTGIYNFALSIKGTTLPEIMSHYDDASVKADIERRINEFQQTLRYNLFPGAMEFLQELQAASIPAAIVTSSDREKMNQLFAQHPDLRGYFAAVIDAAKVTRSKPDPQGYLLAASELGCEPENCFVFEDSKQGIKAGRASGATVIGVATTYPRHEIEADADTVIGSIAEISVERMLSSKRCG